MVDWPMMRLVGCVREIERVALIDRSSNLEVMVSDGHLGTAVGCRYVGRELGNTMMMSVVVVVAGSEAVVDPIDTRMAMVWVMQMPEARIPVVMAPLQIGPWRRPL